ncbi:hypothetical protein PSU4_47970 [Pseudonocardia sulfidoxydans NBRC 16205]|uniref:ANTAR domain-containing protein n=1 Tax=Pseudonocardia sulfidoxydans NBRC 16205 TaxID=1223511 RepID=A0A511DNI5_9PSEU|nr:ANTAR domain-containing protein [Pseudonocardia sulfidoxydans]GEL25843.1 hypothetical protein PSU4_47970 [Pseudonocardia sulfidoxydans NBRC 16205]
MDETTTATGTGTHPWAFEFSTFAAAVARSTSTGDALRVVVDAGRTLVPAADLVSVTVRRADGTFETAAASGPLAARLDDLQYRLREGPCVMASRRAGLGLYESSDVGADRRLPHWGPAAAGRRVRSVLSVGLFAHEDPPRVAALTFVSHTRGGLDYADRDVAVVLAAHAASVLDARADLREALRHRDVIGHATGVLMEREGLGEQRAVEILESVSQRMNVKLSAIARTMATHRAGL